VIVPRVEVEWAKVSSVPVKAFASPRSVVEATTIFAVPLKETPLIVRAFWSAVAVPEFPDTDPVIRFENVSLPLKVSLSPKRVELAAETVSLVSPSVRVVPFNLIVEFVRPLLLRVPVSVGAKVKVPPEFPIVWPSVRPLNDKAEDVASVIWPSWGVP
jgi:hypothetical protein